MTETGSPHQSSSSTTSELRTLRSTGGDPPLTEEAVCRLIHEEVAAAVATALAHPMSGAGELHILIVAIQGAKNECGWPYSPATPCEGGREAINVISTIIPTLRDEQA